jgi:hypothetical protein
MTEKEHLAGVTKGEARRAQSQYMRRKNGERVEYLPLKEELKRSGLP